MNDRAYVGGSYVDLPPTSPYDVWFADVGASFDTATGAVVGGGSGAGTAATTNALYFQTKIAVSSYIPRFAVYDVLTVKTLDGSTNRFLTAGGGGAPAVGDGRVVRTVGTSLEVYDAAGVEFCGNDPIFPVVGYACEPLWRGELPAGVALDARPTVAHGHAFVPLLHGSVVAFRTAGCGAATCAPEWTARAGSVHVGAVVVTDTTMFVASDGRVYAFDARGCGAATCTPLWHGDTGAEVRWSPTVSGGRVFVVNDAGDLVAFGLR